MKKIVFLAKSISDASTRYRAEQYVHYLNQNGYQVEIITLSGGVWAYLNVLKKAYQADIVVIIRKTLPLLHLTLLRWVTKHLVFDFDDAIFCRSDGSASKTREQRFKKMIKNVDMVFAGNDYLAETAKQITKQVLTLPTTLELDDYLKSVNTKESEHIDLVWIGSQSTSKYLKMILPVLDKAYQKNGRLRLKVIADFSCVAKAIPVITIPWSAETEIEELKSSHIGIAPMQDDKWTRGKCALKVLQYMAAGLPVVTVEVGVNGEAVEHGVSGFLVEGEDAWLNAISRLSNESKLRTSMGEKGIEIIRQRYDLKVAAREMVRTFDLTTNPITGVPH